MYTGTYSKGFFSDLLLIKHANTKKEKPVCLPERCRDVVINYCACLKQNSIDNLFFCKCTKLLYGWQHWWSLNLAVWPHTKHKKLLRNCNLAVVPCSVLHQYEHCTCILGSIAIFLLEILEQSREFANLQEC